MTNPIALKMEQLVITYFDACRTDDAAAIAACFAPDAVHYLPNHPPLLGGEAIGTFIVEHLRNLGGEYFIDRILTNVEQCAATVEWSRTFHESDRILRGHEFYEFDPASIFIREVRGYFAAGPNPEKARHELVSFDYAGRGYKTLPGDE